MERVGQARGVSERPARACAQQVGFGVAVALFPDVTVVPLLLGARTWYLPQWLRWLPHAGVERSVEARRPSAEPA
jgi:hypothetical protein